MFIPTELFREQLSHRINTVTIQFGAMIVSLLYCGTIIIPTSYTYVRPLEVIRVVITDNQDDRDARGHRCSMLEHRCPIIDDQGCSTFRWPHLNILTYNFNKIALYYEGPIASSSGGCSAAFLNLLFQQLFLAQLWWSFWTITFNLWQLQPPDRPN